MTDSIESEEDMKDDWVSILMFVGSAMAATYHLVQVFSIAP